MENASKSVSIRPVDQPRRRQSWTSWLSSAAAHVLVLLALSYFVIQTSRDDVAVIEVTLSESKTEAAEFSAPIEALLPKVEFDQEEITPNAITIENTPLPQSSVSIANRVLPDITTVSHAASEAGGASGGSAAKILGRVSKAGGKSGEVQFSLAWPNRDDVDLHVIAPSGQRISYVDKQSQCKGELDVDMNVSGETTEPVENVRWLKNEAPMGRYTVLVNLYQRRVRNTYNFELYCKVGERTELIRHSFTRSAVSVHRFVYVPQSYPIRQREAMIRKIAEVQKREDLVASRLLSLAMNSGRRQALMEIVNRFPHTDAAIRALELMASQSGK